MAHGKVRFYEKEVPDIEDVVMVKVLSLDRPDGDARAGLGAYAELLEYGGIQGLVLLSELSRRRIRSLNKIIKIGDITAVRVINLSRERNFVDLSKRRVHPSEAAAHQEYYEKGKRLDSLLRRVSASLKRKGEDVSLETLYRTVAWPLYKLKKEEEESELLFDHALDALEASVRQPSILENLPEVPESVREELISLLKKKMLSHPFQVRADVDVTCFAYHGVEGVKRALRAGEEATKKYAATTSTIRLIAAPLYMVQAETQVRQDGFDAVQNAIQAIKEAIEKEGGRLAIVTEPRLTHVEDDHTMEEEEDEETPSGGAAGSD